MPIDPDAQVADTREEFENQSQLNANMASDNGYNHQTNRKRTYDAYQDLDLTAARRSQVAYDNTQARVMRSFDSLLSLQERVNAQFFRDQETANTARLREVEEARKDMLTIRADRARYADDAEYVTRYDLSNPVTTGTGDNVRAGAANSQRITDTTGAVAGGAVDVAAAGVATANLAVLQQLVTALTQATATLSALAPVLVTAAGGASTPSQTKPPVSA
jgi:hypothetical protein